LVWREGADGAEIAIVHRPRYDDWSLPKGKVQPGETHLAAALREVREETGSTVTLSRRLKRIAYTVEGTPKTVDYWAMRYRDGTFTVNDEVDQLLWLPAGSAGERLSYRHDREVLDSALAQGLPDSTVVLVRHAKAGKRAQWKSDDSLRPLERAGRDQARELVRFLLAFDPEQVIAAAPVRCVQTVEPLARALGMPVASGPEFSDEHYLRRPAESLNALRQLAACRRSVVVCSQGDTIPGLIGQLGLDSAPSSAQMRKAAAWVVSFAQGRAVAADYYARATAEMPRSRTRA
jgi:8-oxo-dGTP diphosphatase